MLGNFWFCHVHNGHGAMADFWRIFSVCRCTVPFEELLLSSTATPSQSVDQGSLPLLFQIRWQLDALSTHELQLLLLGVNRCLLMEPRSPLYLSLEMNPGIRRYSRFHTLRVTFCVKTRRKKMVISKKIKYDGRWDGANPVFFGSFIENYCALWSRLVHIVGGIGCDHLHSYLVVMSCSWVDLLEFN